MEVDIKNGQITEPPYIANPNTGWRPDLIKARNFDISGVDSLPLLESMRLSETLCQPPNTKNLAFYVRVYNCVGDSIVTQLRQ